MTMPKKQNDRRGGFGSGQWLAGESTTNKNMNDCECKNWPRGINENPLYASLKSADGIPLLPNHHPNCSHYNHSLMDVWKVTHCGTSCFVDNEQDANDTAGSECDASGGDTVSIVKTQMHREVFENLREFDGF